VDELLPRDKVSQAIMGRLAEQGTDHVWLDATGLERFGERFPTIAASLKAVGLDPRTDWLPVAPAAHYICGGIVADLDGASSLPGLWVAGEAACNGVHGANRLASNSLLDGMVFGPRVVEAVERGMDGPSPTGAMRCVLDGDDDAIPGRRLAAPPAVPTERAATAEAVSPVATASSREALQRAMTVDAGVLRFAASLERARDAATAVLARARVDGSSDGATCELANLATVGWALATSALARSESRGAHARTDHPDIDPAQRLRYVVGGGAVGA
jgi:L-aspartate oxidase